MSYEEAYKKADRMLRKGFLGIRRDICALGALGFEVSVEEDLVSLIVTGNRARTKLVFTADGQILHSPEGWDDSQNGWRRRAENISIDAKRLAEILQAGLEHTQAKAAQMSEAAGLVEEFGTAIEAS
tara:strand:- start:834 stop:1214 length:381 start_codon:yes stop_codon:yes gene_type:complete